MQKFGLSRYQPRFCLSQIYYQKISPEGSALKSGRYPPECNECAQRQLSTSGHGLSDLCYKARPASIYAACDCLKATRLHTTDLRAVNVLLRFTYVLWLLRI